MAWQQNNLDFKCRPASQSDDVILSFSNFSNNQPGIQHTRPNELMLRKLDPEYSIYKYEINPNICKEYRVHMRQNTQFVHVVYRI